MTDNEIIKGLRCCGRENCFGCPYRGKCHQGNPMIIDALNLITRQQLEIEKLKISDASKEEYTIKQHGKIKELKARVERLNKEIQITKDDYTMLQTKIEIIKSEAIKEFADRLKHSFFDNGYESPDIDFDYFVDNLVKEMVGDDNA